jgi:hypothetical protein
MTIIMLFCQELRNWVFFHVTAVEVIICREHIILAGKSVEKRPLGNSKRRLVEL